MIEAFEKHYGTDEGVRVFRAPGRVNLIGEHTDYNLGFVLPVALELACFAASAPSGDGRFRVFSENEGSLKEWAAAQTASLKPSGDWTDYVIGVAQQLASAGFHLEPRNILVRSTVPVGGGLSSSAAIEVSSALALLSGQPIDPLELAKLCRRAEGEFVGMPCGIMDQYVSLFGQENAAIQIDCRSLRHEAIDLPKNVAILAVNSMVKHELGQSAYRQRVAECAAAVEVARLRFAEVQSLRDLSLAELESVAWKMFPAPLKRARHIIGENERVEHFVSASKRRDLPAMGALFVESHRSLQHDYEVSCEELDFLVDTALGIDGVYGARMTGGGFGGCTVNLVQPEASGRFGEAISRAYRQRFQMEPKIYPCRPSAGAGEVDPGKRGG